MRMRKTALREAKVTWVPQKNGQRQHSLEDSCPMMNCTIKISTTGMLFLSSTVMEEYILDMCKLYRLLFYQVSIFIYQRSKPIYVEGTPIYFRGNKILQAIFNYLLKDKIMQEATDVILTGCSGSY